MSSNRVTKSNTMNNVVTYQQQKFLGRNEQKLALALISLINPDDDDLETYVLTLSEISRLTGIAKGDLYEKTVRHMCVGLTSTVFIISEPGCDTVVPFFQRAKFLHDKHVEFIFSPELKPHLLNLKGSFTTYQLSQITSLSSGYAIRMYELFRQHLSLADVNSGKTSVHREFDLERFRELLGVLPTQYQKICNFYDRVLKPAQAELAEKTDLKFSYTSVKGARGKVVGLTLLIQVNASNTVDPQFEAVPGQADTLPECRDPDLLKQLVAIVPSLTADQAVLLVNNYSREMVMESLVGLLAVLSSGQIKTAPAKYLMGILKNKRRDEAQTPARKKKTTEEKLTDRSWAEGLCFDEDWD